MKAFAQAPIAEQAFGTAAQWLPQMLFVAGIVVLGFFITMSIRAKVRRRLEAEPNAQERIAGIKAAHRNRDDILVAESHALNFTQRLAAQLDAKAARLEQLIHEADERIAALSGSSQGDPARAASGPPTPPPRSVRPPAAPARPSHPPEPELDAVTQSIYELADAGRNSMDIARQLDEQIGKVELILALRQM